MKHKIDPEDIRKGDIVRYESEDARYRTQAVEYRAACDGDLQSFESGTHYLLERPEPPLYPYWGMVIGKPGDNTKLAVYLPMEGATHLGWLCTVGDKWIGNAEAKQKLAEGWVIIERPGDEK